MPNRRMEMASSFPSNIVQDILAGLDVKALTRFKCVSKAWFRFISSPSFHDLHCSRSQHNLLLFFRSTISYHNHFGFSYQFSSAHINGRPAIHSRFTAKVDGPIKIILPSCWGLFCLATDTRIYVYNPATLQLLALPPSPDSSATRICGFGFGYIRSTKCYKVVRLLYQESTQRIESSVLQLQSGAKDSELSWRVLEQVCTYFVDEFSLPAFVQGTIYWKIKRSQVRRRGNDDILSFNIEEDEFSVIPYPSDWRYSAYNWTQLVNLEGVLSMVQISASNIAIWAHTDHQWHVQDVIDFRGIDQTLFGQVHCIEDGQIVFASLLRNILIFYDTKQSRFKRLQIHFPVYDLGIYWESLFQLGDSH